VDLGRGRQRLVRRPRARQGDDPGAGVQLAAHHPRHCGVGDAEALDPVQPGPHPRGGNTKPVHRTRPASLNGLEKIVEHLPDRYKLMALLAAWCAMRFGELAELRRG